MQFLNFLAILLAAVSEDPPIEETEEENPELIAYLEYPEEVTPLFSRDLEEMNHGLVDGTLSEGKKQRNYDILAFGQVEVIVPGVGLAFRSYRNNFGFEGNMAVSFARWIKFSASFFRPFVGEARNGFYFGGGLGVVFSDLDYEPKAYPYFPVFVGCHSGKFFLDLVIDTIGFPIFFPLPALRCGVSF